MPDPGIYFRFLHSFAQPRPAVFLDRDGVIVEEVGYLHRIEDMRLIPGVAEAVREWNRRSIPVVVVTNQAGIARGYYDWDAFVRLQAAIERELATHGAVLDGVWACGYHPDGAGPLATDHPFRKPNPGMILDAARRMNLHLPGSLLVGDKSIDLQAAQNAGLAGAVLVRTGYGREMEAGLGALPKSATRIQVADDLLAVVRTVTSLPGDPADPTGIPADY